MTRMTTMIGGLAVALAAALVPPPQQVFKSPKVLYGAAIVKAATGDAEGALRLLQRSTDPAPAPGHVRSASATCPLDPRA